jgi:hypothetical protein
MFSKTILVSAFAALAAAQSAVLTFTNVPNPITDGQAQAITFATNDTSSVSILCNSVTLRITNLHCTAREHHLAPRSFRKPPGCRDFDHQRAKRPIHLDSLDFPAQRQQLRSPDQAGQRDQLLRSLQRPGRQLQRQRVRLC